MGSNEQSNSWTEKAHTQMNLSMKMPVSRCYEYDILSAILLSCKNISWKSVIYSPDVMNEEGW